MQRLLRGDPKKHFTALRATKHKHVANQSLQVLLPLSDIPKKSSPAVTLGKNLVEPRARQASYCSYGTVSVNSSVFMSNQVMIEQNNGGRKLMGGMPGKMKIRY